MDRAPKIHEQDDGKFVVMDLPETPFWWAYFRSKEEAQKAFDLFVTPKKQAELRTIAQLTAELIKYKKLVKEYVKNQ